MTTIATSSLYSGTINGLNSLDLDTLQVTDINTTNIDGNYFSINTIEANDIQVDNELELTLNGFITIGKNTPEEITITDTQVGYLDGVTSNIQSQIDDITFDTTDIENRLSTAEGEIDIIQTDIISLESNVVTLQNKTQKFDSGGNINQGIVVAGIINASAQEQRINRINFYQQPVGLPELVIATLRANQNKSINDLYLNTYSNDLDILSNQININCGIKFNDNSIQTTAFTDILKQQVLDNESEINTLQTDVTAIDTRLTTAESEIDVLQTDVTAIDTRLTTAESEIDVLQTDVTAIDTRLTTAESEIDTLQTDVTAIDTRLTTAESEIDTLQTDVTAIDNRLTTAESEIDTLQNKTQKFDSAGNINQGIVVAGIINASTQEQRINRINFYQQPVGLPELLIATLKANQNKAINDLYLNTFTNDLDIYSNQININCDIKFNDNSIQTTAFTDVLKQQVLDNEINITANTNDIITNTSNISINANNISINTSNISINANNIATNANDIVTNSSNITTLQNKTQKFDSGGNIISGIVVGAIINASAQELRINRINFYQQPVGFPELVIATLRSPTNKSVNDLELNTFTNDLNILSNQININCDIKFNDNSIQTTAFTDVLKQQVLDNETNITTNTNDIIINANNIATNTADIATLYQSLVPVGTIIITAQPLTIAPPSGYDFCIGTLKSTSGKYSALYALIGNTYQGNKPSYSGNFYLPDLRQVYIKGSGQSNTYTTSSLATSTGQYQQQSVQQHKHDYEVPANTNNVTSTSADNRSVYDNTRITTQTTTLRDKNNNIIPASLDETRPDTVSLNYLIKY